MTKIQREIGNGILSEVIFMHKCIENNIICCIPFDKACLTTYDIITTYESYLNRCQIKTTTHGNYCSIHRPTAGGRYTKKHCDIIVAVNQLTQDCFIIPIEQISNIPNKRSTTLRKFEAFKNKFDILKQQNASCYKIIQPVLKTDFFNEEILAMGQVCDRFNVHPNTVRRYADKGLLKSFKIGSSKHRRFYLSNCIEYFGGIKKIHHG